MPVKKLVLLPGAVKNGRDSYVVAMGSAKGRIIGSIDEQPTPQGWRWSIDGRHGFAGTVMSAVAAIKNALQNESEAVETRTAQR